MSDERYVNAPPAGAEGWREVWREDRKYPAGGAVQKILRRIFLRGASAELDRQRDFNLVLLDIVRDLRGEIEALRRDARTDLDDLQRDMQRADEAIASEFRKIIPIASKRNDALVAALDQKIEAVAARLRDLTNPPAAGADRRQVSAAVLYRRLEDGLRGSETEIRESLLPYVVLARDHQPVIDVGCGRGEVLAMLKEAGVTARGFDTNERSVADLQRRGFDVALAGIPECLQEMGDGSTGSIIATHVVEHLPVDALFALYREAARVLKRDGLLMIETPNAESLLVTGREFWRDPTHLAPRHPAALTLLAREHEFEIAEIRAVHPFPDAARLASSSDDPPAIRRIVEMINERLFGPQDLRLILRKA